MRKALRNVAGRKMYQEANIAQQMAIQQRSGEMNAVDVPSTRSPKATPPTKSPAPSI